MICSKNKIRNVMRAARIPLPEFISSMIKSKTFEEYRTHFKYRLLERYGIEITDDEYKDLLKENKFRHLFSKTRSKVIGRIDIKGKMVYVLKMTQYEDAYATCYPGSLEESINGAIRACFSPYVRSVAHVLCNEYLKEHDSIGIYETIKEAALDLEEKTLFFSNHMSRIRQGKLDVFRLMNTIRKIIDNDHPRLKICVTKK